MTSVIVVGDAHISDDQNLDRFKALGKMIDDKQPEYVVLIGDFLSMDCLSEWDRNKRKLMENRRYKKEVAAGNTALTLMGAGSQKHTEFIYIEGNHENRLTRYLESDPTFDGMCSIPKDLSFHDRNIGWIPYKECLTLDGVSFTHIPINSGGKPIGNPNVANKALNLFQNSVVFGHSHTLDHAAAHRHGSEHLNQALCVGCFFEHVDAYAQGSMTNYWRGVVELDIYATNRFDVTTTSMRQLYNQYGVGHATAAARTKKPRR